jgi:hypothetical protein
LYFRVVGTNFFSAGAAKAINNQTLYQYCKPWADSAFTSTTDEALLCNAYIMGALDYAKRVCYELEDVAKENPDLALTRSYFGAAKSVTSRPAIQAYVNKMQKEPDKWKYTPSRALPEVFREVVPC